MLSAIMSEIRASPEPAEAAPITPVHDPYAVLRNPDYVRYLCARFVASVGQAMLTVAVGWELYERTHSALNLGLVGLTQMVPMVLFTLPAGHIADNFKRNQIILWMTFLIGRATLGMALISVLHPDVIWIYFVLF